MILVATIFSVGCLVGNVIILFARLLIDVFSIIEHFWFVASSKPVVRDSEEFIVQQTLVDCKEAHHEPEVAGHGKAFHAWALLQLRIEEAKHASECEENAAVAVVTVHDCIEEWEGDNLEDCWVDLTICGKLVSVDSDLMERKHVISLEG